MPNKALIKNCSNSNRPENAFIFFYCLFFKNLKFSKSIGFCLVIILTLPLFSLPVFPQGTTVTGAFEGTVKDNLTSSPILGAAVEITNEQTGVKYNLVTDSRGIFFQGGLLPGHYAISIFMEKYRPQTIRLQLKISKANEVVPVPITLIPDSSVVQPVPSATVDDQTANVRGDINTTDARRDGSFQQEEQPLNGQTPRRASNFPLGGRTITRTFDELALLLPGVAPPPQTIGDTVGPGVGPGVGSAGQFAVNGLRSRANNFTVDGSDNNDEDIGVRRQGFIALVSQPIESIQEYQVITLLAPAQFGRNIGAQVNAVSKQGGSKTHGSIYGFFNSDKLNARNYFDTTNGSETFALRSLTGQAVLLDGSPLTVRNQSGGEDSFTFGQAGGILGGKIITNKLFYFLSGEYQKINAVKEKNFAVPSLEQRAAFRSGTTGLYRDFNNNRLDNPAIPTSDSSAAIFSLFPFANNPSGIYQENTFTQILPASGEGLILSGRMDDNFKIYRRNQSFTARYNFTDDRRNIPAVGDALFAAVLSKIQTQNLSLFLNNQLSKPSSDKQISNQLRFSAGRSHLKFDEVRDTEFLIPSDNYPNTPFLLNSRFRFNLTTPPSAGVPNTGAVNYTSVFPSVNQNFPDLRTSEPFVGPIGQVKLAGFSTLGTDVYNFPQDRTNLTYQIADEITIRSGKHSFVFGADIRRTTLDSDLPRLSRPLLSFNGVPRLIFENGAFRFPGANDPNPFLRPEDLLGLNTASDFLLTFNVDRPDSRVKLLYQQLNFYGQDTWRITPQLSFSYGLRYEYNTPIKEAGGLIEQTFNDERLSAVPGLKQFIDGRARLYEPDYNNFAPRVGIAYSPNLFGNNLASVFRAGYGIFYDQILGAVANQSRNVFPTYLTLNYGGLNSRDETPLVIFNPGLTTTINRQGVRATLNAPGTVNIFNPALNLTDFIQDDRRFFPNAVNATLPARNMEMPMAHHYSFSFEQQIGEKYALTIGYVGTRGQNLLRFETPNLGSSLTVAPTSLLTFEIPFGNQTRFVPLSLGRVFNPNRPVNDIGAINIFSTTAASVYNALQTEFRGRLSDNFNFQFSYVLSKVEDDVSDVFDLAGANVLPQNSFDLKAECALANFDIRNRFSYYLTYDFPKLSQNYRYLKWLTDNLQITGTGKFHSGQPFTVNSIIDVNLDGNLTDRLDNLDGLVITGDRSQPLRLATDNPFTMLAPFGQDGKIKRNSFRAGNILELDMSLNKRWDFDSRGLTFRTDIFNFINRANFGVPVRLLEAPGFGRVTNTVTPGRRIQFALKYEF